MAKKSFSSGLNSLLEPTSHREEESVEATLEAQKKRGRPRTSFKEVTITSEEGTRPEEIRATFIVKKQTLEKVKALAFWDRVQIKNVIHEAIEAYLEQKGDKHIKQALDAFCKRDG